MAKLATMDIFAGCGGLTCGLHKAGAAETKWSIEYEQPAAEAFKYATYIPQAVASPASAVLSHCGCADKLCRNTPDLSVFLRADYALYSTTCLIICLEHAQ